MIIALIYLQTKEYIMKEQVLNETQAITIGISACVLGQNVRFNGGAKPLAFCLDHLSQYVTFKPFCPEVAIGMPIPRPAIRQIRENGIIKIAQPDGSGDVTQELSDYGKKIAEIAKDFSGFIFCAKSPSCGMERVKIYSTEGKPATPDGIGAFAREIMQANPLLPCEENGRLNDPKLRENFVARVFAYHKWRGLVESGLTIHKLTTFHSEFKYALMSHDLVAYKELGQLLARADLSLNDKAEKYIFGLMKALKIVASRKKHSNTLQHIQGYFSKHLNAEERHELSEVINSYREGMVPLFAPLTLIKHYLLRFPKSYLQKQFYLSPHPAELKLRYSL